MEKSKEVLEYIIKAIVDNQSAVKIESRVDELGVLITLAVASEDMGKVIGKQGNTAMALRTLLHVLGSKEKAKINLKITEPDGSSRVHKEDSGYKDLVGSLKNENN